MPFSLKSPSFQNDQPIPPRYTADGDNLSPPLEWSEPPPGTQSFALIVEDPDAPSGVFRHWGGYTIPGGPRTPRQAAGHGARTGGMGQGRRDLGHPRCD